MTAPPEFPIRIVTKPTGRGLVSARAFAPGETILEATGVIRGRPTRTSLQIDRDRHLDVPEGAASATYPWQFLEHACRPNAAFRGQRLEALVAIAPGDELTFDYETTEWELGSPFACACASMGCTGRTIRGFRHLTHEERMRRLPQLRDDLRHLVLADDPAPPSTS